MKWQAHVPLFLLTTLSYTDISWQAHVPLSCWRPSRTQILYERHTYPFLVDDPPIHRYYMTDTRTPFLLMTLPYTDIIWETHVPLSRWRPSHTQILYDRHTYPFLVDDPPIHRYYMTDTRTPFLLMTLPYTDIIWQTHVPLSCWWPSHTQILYDRHTYPFLVDDPPVHRYYMTDTRTPFLLMTLPYTDIIWQTHVPLSCWWPSHTQILYDRHTYPFLVDDPPVHRYYDRHTYPFLVDDPPVHRYYMTDTCTPFLLMTLPYTDIIWQTHVPLSCWWPSCTQILLDRHMYPFLVDDPPIHRYYMTDTCIAGLLCQFLGTVWNKQAIGIFW